MGLVSANTDSRRCTSTGRQCEGYTPLKPSNVVLRQLAPAPTVDSPRESRALEFFFQKTAPQLAGFFAGTFFQGSVLQVSLTEPAIRQAIAAVGILHEQTASATSPVSKDSSRWTTSIRLYNRSIRAIIEKTATDPNALPLIAMTNILFTCFEYFQGNPTTAASHVQNGINLLRAWRAKNGGSRAPWGQNYTSFEPHFMETEIAPLLSIFSINTSQCVAAPRTNVLLNPVDKSGRVVLADQFETLDEARIALMDLITAAVWRVELSSNQSAVPGPAPSPASDAAQIFTRTRHSLDEWRTNLANLTRRQKHTWTTKQTRAADVLTLMWHSTNFGLKSYTTTHETAWDAHRTEYEELINLTEAILSDRDRFPDEISRTLSLDFGMIFHLHIVAWKCRWPHLRRKGLDLLRRSPKREWLFESGHYHAIFTRIMEIEEAHLDLGPDIVPGEDVLPPEHVRIHDFSVVAQPARAGEPPTYAVTFASKPWGPDGPWRYATEIMHLENAQPGRAAVPVSMITRNAWQMPQGTNFLCANMIDSETYGLGQ